MRQHGVPFRVRLCKTGVRGWGVVAEEFIPLGAYVMEYCGEVVKAQEVSSSRCNIGRNAWPRGGQRGTGLRCAAGRLALAGCLAPGSIHTAAHGLAGKAGLCNRHLCELAAALTGSLKRPLNPAVVCHASACAGG